MDNEEFDFEEMQNEMSEINDASSGNDRAEKKPNMTIDHMLNREQAENVNTIRSRIENIRKEVERTGKYYDRENNVNLSKRQAEAKIKSLENEIYKEMGYPWYERNASNPLEALLQAIAKMIMYILDGEYRRSKKMALEREDDNIRSQMDIRLSNIRRLAENEVENYLNPQRSSRSEREEPAMGFEGGRAEFEGKAPHVRGRDNTEFDFSGWPNADNKDGKEQGESYRPVNAPTAEDIAKTEKEAKRREISEKIQLRRNKYVSEKYGMNYSDMSPEQKAEANANFIVCEKHTKDRNGRITQVPNYRYIDGLEEEAKTPDLAKALFEAMKENLPDHAKKHYEENTIQCVPFVAPYYLSKIKNELLEKGSSIETIQNAIDKNAAMMIAINPEVLRYLPEGHINDKLQELTALYRQELIEKHIKAQEREQRSIEKITKNGDDISKAYKAPEVTKYLEDLKKVADKENNPTISKFVTSVYTEYVLDYVRGYDMNFSKESALGMQETKHVTIPESVIESKAFQDELAIISSDPESRATLRSLANDTLERIEREKEITSPENSERLEQLDIEKEGLEQLVSEFDRLDERDKEPETEPAEETKDEVPEQNDEEQELSDDGPKDDGPEPEEDKTDDLETTDVPESVGHESEPETEPEQEPDSMNEGSEQEQEESDDKSMNGQDAENLFGNDEQFEFDPSKIGPKPELEEDVQKLFSSFEDAVESIENNVHTEDILVERENENVIER